MMFVLVLSAVLIGCLMPVQATINAHLGRIIDHSWLAVLISMITGTLAMLIVFAFKGGVPLESVRRIPFSSPHLLVGGVLGALFVASTILLIPKLGATTLIAAFVTGQLVMSVILDHYGVLGLKVHPVSTQRLFGIILLFAGLWLVIRKPG